MTDKRKNNKLLIQIIKFLIVGGTATIIDFSIFFILHDLTKQNTINVSLIEKILCIISIVETFISIGWLINSLFMSNTFYQEQEKIC